MNKQIDAEIVAALAAIFEKHFGPDWNNEELSPESYYTNGAMLEAMREGM